ncbi:hypothetical protein TELCIR_16118 [Teladorsagia circumcincta]|uniref:SCP domain-containing protein n=1 Tax=Teladorsagia circumcincta TaxID=45464 RepID=A0A2G9TWD9_TELCI|nr:hypothetical protein TELCIR_16118 [Teladorsagia circumcincta]
MRFAFLNVLLLLDSYTHAQRLTISTTYQAEDAGLIPTEHPQCRAWMLWWKTQEVDINFENVCRLHPRVLRIASRSLATKYYVNTDVLCRMNNTQAKENS